MLLATLQLLKPISKHLKVCVNVVILDLMPDNYLD